MTRHAKPLRSCDEDCARVNHCSVGGYQCQECGTWFCPGNGGNELCEDCWKKKESEAK